MPLTKKIVAMAAGLVASLAAATVAQQPQAGANGRSQGETIVVGDATLDWIERSQVAALREGVVDKMELQVGDEVKEKGIIGYLHNEMAKLTVAKAKVAATNDAAVKKAEAQKELSIAVLARSIRLRNRIKDAVSEEEYQKNEAQVKVDHASVLEAEQNLELAKAELALAERALEEHIIRAPFDSLITERQKNPGETVRANEPVVHVVRIDKLRVSAWVPIESSYRMKVGDVIDIQPNVPGRVLPIEQKKFRGKVTFIDPEVEPLHQTVRFFAEVDNRDHELRPGLKADVVIYPGTAGAEAPAVGADAPAVGAVAPKTDLQVQPTRYVKSAAPSRR